VRAAADYDRQKRGQEKMVDFLVYIIGQSLALLLWGIAAILPGLFFGILVMTGVNYIRALINMSDQDVRIFVRGGGSDYSRRRRGR